MLELPIMTKVVPVLLVGLMMLNITPFDFPETADIYYEQNSKEWIVIEKVEIGAVNIWIKEPTVRNGLRIEKINVFNKHQAVTRDFWYGESHTFPDDVNRVIRRWSNRIQDHPEQTIEKLKSKQKILNP